MKTYKIISSYPCLIKTETQSIALEQNFSVILEKERTVSVYPVGKTDKFAFDINLNRLGDSPFFCTAQNENETIIYLIDGIKSENAQVVSFGSNTSSHIEISDDSVTFFSNSHKRTIMTGHYENYDCYQKHDIMLAHLYSDNKHLVLAFNKKSGKAKSFRADNVELKDDTLILSHKLGDYADQTMHLSLSIDREGLKKTDCHFTYSFDKPRLATCDRVVPYAFLEAVKTENYCLAQSYLSSSLEIDEEKLKAFIGKLDFFFPIANNKFCFHSGEGLKTIVFEISNSKICDIDIN